MGILFNILIYIASDQIIIYMIDKVVITLCLIQALSNASYSLVSPFYPLEVKKKGIDEIYIGPIMG